LKNRAFIIGAMIFVLMTLTACDQSNQGVSKFKNYINAFVGTIKHLLHRPSVLSMVAGVTVIKDFAYGAHQKNRFDIYAPEKTISAPIIIMLHGGGWAGGDKEAPLSYINKVNRWLPKGFIVISVETQLLPDADVYQQIDELAMAVATVQKYAAEWGGDPKKVMLMGHSSAGTMVSVLAANPSLVYQQGGQPWLASFSIDATSLDIPRAMRLWAPGMIKRAFGDNPNRWLTASPINLLNHESLPLLMACSTQRGDSPCEQAELFAKEANKFGVITKVVPQDFDHGGVDFNLGLDAGYTQTVEVFMASLDPAISRLLNVENNH
jgi:arylformamidase